MSIEKRAAFASADRRQFPRVAITMPVMLSRQKRQTIKGLIQNITPGGMLVRLSAQSAAALVPQRKGKGSLDNSPIEAQFLVPLRQQRVPISVSCLLAHATEVDGAPEAARMAIGYRFKRFKDQKTLRRFVSFIEEQLVPVEDYQLYLHGPASSSRKPRWQKSEE